MVEVVVYEADIGWTNIELAVAKLDRVEKANLIAELAKQYEDIVVGLPSDSVNPCSLALAYLYTLEDLKFGSRVRNKAILFLMNLLGLNQVKDVVESVSECRAVAVIGLPNGARATLFNILTRMGITGYSVRVEKPECAVSELVEVTLSRVDKL